MKPHPFESLPMILVSGQARSGTTILTQAIGAHPQVFSNLLESTYIRDVLRLFQDNLTDSSRIRQMLADEDHFVKSFRTALYHVLFPEDHLPVNTPIAVSTFSSLMPEYADQLPVLFPSLYLVNIVRNGIEVVSSRMRHASIGIHTFEEHCRAWSAAVGMVRWGADRDNFFVVRHEQIRDEHASVGVIEKLQGRLGLAGSSRVITLLNKKRVSSNENDDASPLDKRKERWKTWSMDQRQTFDEICSEAMDFFGYEIPWTSNSC